MRSLRYTYLLALALYCIALSTPGCSPPPYPDSVLVVRGVDLIQQSGKGDSIATILQPMWQAQTKEIAGSAGQPPGTHLYYTQPDGQKWYRPLIKTAAYEIRLNMALEGSGVVLIKLYVLPTDGATRIYLPQATLLPDNATKTDHTQSEPIAFNRPAYVGYTQDAKYRHLVTDGEVIESNPKLAPNASVAWYKWASEYKGLAATKPLGNADLNEFRSCDLIFAFKGPASKQCKFSVPITIDNDPPLTYTFHLEVVGSELFEHVGIYGGIVPQNPQENNSPVDTWYRSR